MLEENTIREIVKKAIDDNDIFIVDINVGSNNKITVYLDKYRGLSLDDCERIHRKIYPEIEQLEDKFDLTVSSPGLTSEFKVWQQYHKNIGQEIEIILTDGRTVRGKITEADEEKVSLQTKKEQLTIPYTDIKKAKLILKF